MKLKVLFFIAITVFAISSCVVENRLLELKQKSQDVSLTIPIEEAIEQLDVFLNRNFYLTRGQTISYSDVEVVSSRQMTRSNGESLPKVDTLLYLINFGEDSGYAILSADKRLGTSIIAVTECGSISSNDFDFSIQNATRVEGGGTLGSGSDDLGDGDDDGNLPNDFIVEFVEGQLGDGFNYGGIIAPPSDTTHNYSVAPMLTTIWGQDSPYNLKCPIEDGVQTPAGCVAVAVGQVAAFLELDCSQLENNYDWSIIKSVGSIVDHNDTSYTSAQEEQISTFIREVGDMCDIDYDIDSSTTLPWKINNCLNEFKCENNTFYIGYDVSDVTRSLSRGNPVIVSAARNWAIKGHTWVIDGYDIHYNPYDENNNVLVHCNWGWCGLCNGFYYSGVFDVVAGAVIRDSNYGDIQDTNNEIDANYTWMFSTVLLDN